MSKKKRVIKVQTSVQSVNLKDLNIKIISRELVFQPQFLEDLKYWVDKDNKVAKKVFDIIEAIKRDPFQGIGKPEHLKYLGPDVWSRRLTLEHRITYRVTVDTIYFLQSRYHYGND